MPKLKTKVSSDLLTVITASTTFMLGYVMSSSTLQVIDDEE